MLKIFNLSLKINGFPIKEAEEIYNQIINQSEEEYSIFLKNKKNEVVAFHSENNPLYKNLIHGKKINDWFDLPVMTKKDFQQPLLQRLSIGYDQKNIYVNKTSGSSGDPFIFAKDKFCHALTWVNIIHKFGDYGIDFNKSKQARFYGIPLDFVGYNKERLKDFIKKSYRFPIFDLSDKVLENVLTKFRKTSFDYINGYTSSIVLFAKFLKQKEIK